ncbi:MAG: DUF5050 domain-containing protein [Coriobacteriia bacterium]|nr:DUF5050 domain-containing protein [Coriobacteriia bacterium]
MSSSRQVLPATSHQAKCLSNSVRFPGQSEQGLLPIKNQRQALRASKTALALLLALCLAWASGTLAACSSAQQSGSRAGDSSIDDESIPNVKWLRMGDATYIVGNYCVDPDSGFFYSQIIRIPDADGAYGEEMYRSSGQSGDVIEISLLYGKGGILYFTELQANMTGDEASYSFALKALDVEKPGSRGTTISIHLASAQSLPDSFMRLFDDDSGTEGDLAFDDYLERCFMLSMQLNLEGKYAYYVAAYAMSYDRAYCFRLDCTDGGVEWFDLGPLQEQEGWSPLCVKDGYVYYKRFGFEGYSLSDPDLYRTSLDGGQTECLSSIPSLTSPNGLSFTDHYLYCVLTDFDSQDVVDTLAAGAEGEHHVLYRLHRVDLETLAGDDIVLSLEYMLYDIYEGQVYYLGQNDDLHSCGLDGSNDQLLAKGNPNYFIQNGFVSGGWFYFQAYEYWYRIWPADYAYPTDPVFVFEAD